jgi:hypothetical protein
VRKEAGHMVAGGRAVVRCTCRVQESAEADNCKLLLDTAAAQPVFEGSILSEGTDRKCVWEGDQHILVVQVDRNTLVPVRTGSEAACTPSHSVTRQIQCLAREPISTMGAPSRATEQRSLRISSTGTPHSRFDIRKY